MPKKPEPDDRSPAEASALMDATLKRMLSSPPVPHEKISGNSGQERKKKKRALKASAASRS